MKRMLWAVIGLAGICGVFLLWRGLSRQNTVSQAKQFFSQAYEAEITLHSGDTALTAVVGRDADGDVTLTVKEPSLLSGMVIRRKGSGLTISYGNMEFPLELQEMPASSAVGPLFSLLSGAFDSADATFSETDGRYVLSGESEYGAYTVTLDQSSGAVLQVDFPSLGFTCDFSRFVPAK